MTSHSTDLKRVVFVESVHAFLFVLMKLVGGAGASATGVLPEGAYPPGGALGFTAGYPQ